MHFPVDLVEVSPRDGLQSERSGFSTAQKVELIERLVATGIRRIEATSFVSPRKVPQMADAEALMASLHRPEGVSFIGLVLNQRGFDRAVASGCHEIGMVVVASETFNRRNQGVETGDSIQAWLEIARAAEKAGIRAHVTISAAFGCPFEGEVPQARVIEIAERVAAGHPYEICLADTIGVGVPQQVGALFRELARALPSVRLRGHFHNTRNCGLANAYAAVEAGAVALDASAAGIGGCPFAPAATGNIPSEDLIYMLERSGIETGVSLERLIETARWLEQQMGRKLPGMVSKAGPFPGSFPGASATHPSAH